MIETDAAAVDYVQVFEALVVTDATPEAAVKADIGSFAWDATNNKLYVKDSGAYTNTGWVEVAAATSAAAKAALKSELQAIVASAATWGEFQTDVAAWTASP